PAASATITSTLPGSAPPATLAATPSTTPDRSTSTGAFTVTAGTPVITNINPNSGQQGASNIPVTITGNFTHFSNSSAVTFSGTGVPASTPTSAPASSTTVTATIPGSTALANRV